MHRVKIDRYCALMFVFDIVLMRVIPSHTKGYDHLRPAMTAKFLVVLGSLVEVADQTVMGRSCLVFYRSGNDV